jgi:enoyl-CoA hydratase/carnithine racemase
MGVGRMPEGDPPSGPVVVLKVDDGVAMVTLNRPNDLNMFSGPMGSLLSAAYRECDERDDVRVVVVTGAGRAFCGGADMRPGSASFGPARRGFSAQPIDPPAWAVRKPVIAAINGHAIGIGFTLAMQCDVRIVSLDAKLAIPQARRGVLGDAGSHWTVRHAASRAVAADVLLTGRTFPGSEAVELGLASKAVPADEVLSTALQMATDIAANCSPVSLAMSKRLLWMDATLPATVALETAYHRVVMGGADAAEGPRAWIERRTPRWEGTVNGWWERVLAAEAQVKNVEAQEREV